MNQELKIEHIQIHLNLEIFKGDLEFALTMKLKMTTITVFATLYRLQDNLDQSRHQMALVSGLKLIIWRFVSYSHPLPGRIYHHFYPFSPIFNFLYLGPSS